MEIVKCKNGLDVVKMVVQVYQTAGEVESWIEWNRGRWAGGFDHKRKNVTALCRLGIIFGPDWLKPFSYLAPQEPESCLRL